MSKQPLETIRIEQETEAGQRDHLCSLMWRVRRRSYYQKLGLIPQVELCSSAIGIMNKTRRKSAVIASDVYRSKSEHYLDLQIVLQEHSSSRRDFRPTFCLTEVVNLFQRFSGYSL